jgi:peptidoglycan/xylan/chitin deacetylase (PgdA/CDA1 family)
MTQSGRVTPKGDVNVGIHYLGNIGSESSRSLFEGFEAAVDEVLADDQVEYDETVAELTRAVVAYALDPIGMAPQLSLRYGIYDHLDVGYQYAFGAHVFDGRVQFLGSTSSDEMSMIYASIGAQYSSQTYDLPSYFKLDKLQERLGFEMKRKDILVPLTVGHPFGSRGQYGSINYGVAYGHTSLDYGFDPINVYEKYVEDVDTQPIAAIHNTKSYDSLGGFMNLKAGYQPIFVTASLALYHQEFGDFELIGGDSVHLGGWTLIPTVGIEGTF